MQGSDLRRTLYMKVFINWSPLPTKVLFWDLQGVEHIFVKFVVDKIYERVLFALDNHKTPHGRNTSRT